MEKIIFGHKNPDTDSICSAISLSYLKKELGLNYIPKRLGDLNEETKFVLNYFNFEAPEFIKDVSGYEVVLVDHNERTQTADGFENATVLEVIDHHRVSNFNVSNPLYMRLEPVGCTATILYKMFTENNVEIPKNIAGLLLSAIISDTLLFKSPTCTKEDVTIGERLAKIADVNLQEYGLEMLKAGTNLGSKTEIELLNMDMKMFDVKEFKISVAQVNTVNEDELLLRKEKLLFEMNNMFEKENINLMMFVITNIMTNDSIAIVLGERLDIFEKAFNSEVRDGLITLKQVVSRKKQIIPPLTDTINSL